MHSILRAIPLCLVPFLLAAQDGSRSNQATDAANQNFTTTHPSALSMAAPTNNAPGNMNNDPLNGRNGMTRGSILPEPWPEGSTSVQDKSLPFDGAFAGYAEDGNDFADANARRTFVFLVKPGEKLEFNLKGEDSKVALRTFIPTPPPALKWKLALRNANMPLRSRRSSHLEIKNPTSEVQTLYLVLYGVNGYAYKIDLTRKQPS